MDGGRCPTRHHRTSGICGQARPDRLFEDNGRPACAHRLCDAGPIVDGALIDVVSRRANRSTSHGPCLRCIRQEAVKQSYLGYINRSTQNVLAHSLTTTGPTQAYVVTGALSMTLRTTAWSDGRLPGSGEASPLHRDGGDESCGEMTLAPRLPDEGSRRRGPRKASVRAKVGPFLYVEAALRICQGALPGAWQRARIAFLLMGSRR